MGFSLTQLDKAPYGNVLFAGQCVFSDTTCVPAALLGALRRLKGHNTQLHLARMAVDSVCSVLPRVHAQQARMTCPRRASRRACRVRSRNDVKATRPWLLRESHVLLGISLSFFMGCSQPWAGCCQVVCCCALRPCQFWRAGCVVCIV